MTDRNELEALWDVDRPPPDFAERVLAEVRATARSASNVRMLRQTSFLARRGWLLAAALAMVVAGTGLVIHLKGAFREHGSVVARERTTRAIDGSSVAVLEPEAAIEWRGREVSQTSGDVFYRVEPGRGAFRVETLAGRVEVLGTCFRVKVTGEREESAMQVKRWAGASGAAGMGALLGSVTTVTVYEGQTRLVHGSSSVVVQAGQTGSLDQRGARRVEPDVKATLTSPRAVDATSPAAPGSPLTATKLAALEREKKDLEAQLRARGRARQAEAQA